MSIIQEWHALDGEKQTQMVRSATMRLAYLYYGGTGLLKRGGTEIKDHISAGYIEVFENLNVDTIREIDNERAEKGLGSITLKGYVYRMVSRYLGRALYWAKIDAMMDGGTLDTLGCEIPQEDFSDQLIEAIDIHRFLSGRDDRDRQIAKLLEEYQSERSIGREIGISGTAVHYRIVKMRAALSTERF